MLTWTITVNGAAHSVCTRTLLSELLPHTHAPAMPCGGKGTCGKCKVQASGTLSPYSETERRLLSAQELASGIRLACCCFAEGDCTVQTLAPTAAKIQNSFSLPQFTKDPLFTQFGIAIDIGTTTLAAELHSRDAVLAHASVLNPQAQLGADVMSRIDAALHGKEELLAESIRTALADLITTLCQAANILPQAIDTLIITGNTTMLYLLTQRSPQSFAAAPFAADCLFGVQLSAAELQLPCPVATVYLPPCISAFVGADITTAILASGLTDKAQTALLLDIGTNGEMALYNNDKLICCSTAAGPAFEGAGLSMGMGGKDGAIDHVVVQNGKLCAHVLGEGAPVGICGSGIVDALACLLQTERMDDTGFLEDGSAMIAHPVCITQEDVRKIQLAKSAVCAGAQTLLHHCGIAPQAVAAAYVAGGFGSYLSLESAAAIGLLPPELAENATAIGNAALGGAVLLLLQKQAWHKAVQLAQSAEVIELSTSAFFMEAYTEGMFFPQ